jgi:hypothetical protein
MPNLEEQVNKLRKTIFDMLNYANMYVLVLDEKMEVGYANNSLAIDLGLDKYSDLVGRCWLDFISDDDRKAVTTIHSVVSRGIDNWEKYREFQNNIKGVDVNIAVHWFNSHINSNYNWTFSFGIRREPVTEVTMKSIRTYYRDIIDQDRTMINSMRDMIIFRNKVIDSCDEPIVENNNEASVLV